MFERLFQIGRSVPVEPALPHALPPGLAEALRRIVDPDLGVDILSLGIVREASMSEREARVVLTPTAPLCPWTEHLENEVREAIARAFPGCEHVEVVTRHDPPWSPLWMSEDARRQLDWQ
jgi:metal-sulfur cluster biosynthetic enzyme